MLGARSRLAALVVALPALALFSLAAAAIGFSLVRLVGRTQPELLLPALSALATALGLSWALAPLLAGVSATETHDLGRLMHFPVPLPTLVLSSLVANLAQPTVLAQLPVLAAVSLALAGGGPRGAIAFAALLLALAFTLASAQVVGLALHAVSRRRRWHDLALLAGIALSLAVSLVPILLLSAPGGFARRALRALLERDVFVLVPFSWGVRAAVHAARGDGLAFAGWAAGGTLAVAAAVAVAGALAQRLYRGELDLGEAKGRRARPAAMRLPGVIGALVEKDLRVTWRDPRLKALVFTGLLGPLLVLVAVAHGFARVPPGVMLSLASFTGLGILGANVLAYEREGLALLFGFPVSRFSILIAKNLTSMALRLPALVVIAVATALVAGAGFVPAVVAIVLLTQLVGAAVDDYVSVLLPLPVARAGRDPHAPVSGARGLGAALLMLAAMLATLAGSAPFAFLAWLPHLLRRPWLWALTLPLALGGAAGLYFMLAAGAARLVTRREPDLVARARGEE